VTRATHKNRVRAAQEPRKNRVRLKTTQHHKTTQREQTNNKKMWGGEKRNIYK